VALDATSVIADFGPGKGVVAGVAADIVDRGAYGPPQWWRTSVEQTVRVSWADRGQRQLADERRTRVVLAVVPIPRRQTVQRSQACGAGAHGFDRIEHGLCDRGGARRKAAA